MGSVPVKYPVSNDQTLSPAWEVALLYPPQGMWDVWDYIGLKGNRLVEYIDGEVQVLSMPSDFHQAIVALIYELLVAFVRPAAMGTVRFAPLRLKLSDGQFRMPDVMLLLKANDAKRQPEYWETADLVVEVVSEDDRQRDLVTKRSVYAQGKIPEYWIVDPKLRQITVLKLTGGTYAEHGVFNEGQIATSVLLPGFQATISDIFAAR